METSTYDAANRLTSRQFGGIGGSSHRLDLSYTNANQLENIKRYNASSGGSLIGQTTFTYDTLLRMSGIKNANGGGTVLSQYTYTYDAVNRLTTEVLGGNTKTFTYDVRSQLTGDSTSTYGYDNAGNRNNSSQTITTANRLDLDANWNYTYDDEGNLTSKTSVATPTVTWTYTWDVNNRMVAAVKSAGSTLYSVDYKYDVFGNRIEQIEDADGAGGGSSVTTRFAWEGAGVLQDAWGNRTSPVGTENWNIWADLNGSNGLVTRYVRGDEVDQLFSRVKADGTVAHYLTDRMQSTRQMLDASGVVANTITYDGFGNVLSETDAAFGDRWKWTGREYNNYTGLQYNRARYFSGESGRWASEDPIRFGASDYNINRYVKNNTANIKDASGLDGPSKPPGGTSSPKTERAKGQAKEAIISGIPLDAAILAGVGHIMSESFEFEKEFDTENNREAARHMYWQALTTWYFGSDVANTIGNIHEKGEVEAGRASDSIRDRVNNEYGKIIGKKVSKTFPTKPGPFRPDDSDKAKEEIKRRIREQIEKGHYAKPPKLPEDYGK